MKIVRAFILFAFFSFQLYNSWAQSEKKMLSASSLLSSKKDSTVYKDSLLTKVAPKKDSVKKHDPRIATRRSAILPGWGQAYNKEYWKIPIVYGILAIPAGLYFYNNSYYNKTKFAFDARFREAAGDPSLVPYIDPQLTGLSISSLQNYRNSFRQGRDYSILWFILAWGLQVADATVFGHLKDFDVSRDLTMTVAPSFLPQTPGTGLSLTFNLKNPSHKPALSR